ncbi:MAG: ADP-dependent glucokinase/phosphofructokinase [Candidatus Micrarchaeota archaeon]|nr:ADP-dependent glucokinase/phosphofructokinase [Candidatus Micrarchaeota archaeon]
MGLPSCALFAFNANIDYIVDADRADLGAAKKALPELFFQIESCLESQSQRETKIGRQECLALLSMLKPGKAIVGGQAGNGAQQASALGIRCFLHSNFASTGLLGLFSFPSRVFVATKKGFERADRASASLPSSHHFIFQSKNSNSRFIASYDPLPLHVEEEFAAKITPLLPSIPKAFVGGFHLLFGRKPVLAFAKELQRWKEENPSMRIFCELGDFQSEAAMQETLKSIFPLADMVGMSDSELALFGCSIEELSREGNAILLHSPAKQEVFPPPKLNPAALDFARRCASFKARHAKFATLRQALASKPSFVARPKQAVGLGDSFSCAYFMAD